MEAVYIIWEWPSRRPKQFPPPFLFLPSRWFAFLPPQPGHTHTHTPKRLCVRIDKSTTPLSACLSLLSLQWRENTPEGFPSAATSSNDTQHTHTIPLDSLFFFFVFLISPPPVIFWGLVPLRQTHTTVDGWASHRRRYIPVYLCRNFFSFMFSPSSAPIRHF